MARLTRTRNRVEGPNEAPIPRVVRLDATAGAAIGASKPRDDHAVDIHGRSRDREVVLPALGLNRPGDRARRTIERHELAVEPAHEDVVFTNRDTSVVPAAAD